MLFKSPKMSFIRLLCDVRNGKEFHTVSGFTAWISLVLERYSTWNEIRKKIVQLSPKKGDMFLHQYTSHTLQHNISWYYRTMGVLDSAMLTISSQSSANDIEISQCCHQWSDSSWLCNFSPREVFITTREAKIQQNQGRSIIERQWISHCVWLHSVNFHRLNEPKYIN